MKKSWNKKKAMTGDEDEDEHDDDDTINNE